METPPESETVRVFPYEGGWSVGFGVDYYSHPFSKEEAISQAARIAADARLPGVAVTDEYGNRKHWLSLESLRYG